MFLQYSGVKQRHQQQMMRGRILFYLINSSQLPMWIRRFDNRPSTNNGVITFRELGFLECHGKFGVLF